MTSNSFSARQDYCPTRMRHSSGVRSKVWLSGPDPVPPQARRGLVLKFSSFIQVKAKPPQTDIIAPVINSLPQNHIRSSKLIPVMNLGFASSAPAHLHPLTGACVVAMPTKSCLFWGINTAEPGMSQVLPPRAAHSVRASGRKSQGSIRLVPTSLQTRYFSIYPLQWVTFCCQSELKRLHLIYHQTAKRCLLKADRCMQGHSSAEKDAGQDLLWICTIVSFIFYQNWKILL